MTVRSPRRFKIASERVFQQPAPARHLFPGCRTFPGIRTIQKPDAPRPRAPAFGERDEQVLAPGTLAAPPHTVPETASHTDAAMALPLGVGFRGCGDGNWMVGTGISLCDHRGPHPSQARGEFDRGTRDASSIGVERGRIPP